MLAQISNYNLNLKKTGEKVEKFFGELNRMVFFFDEGRFGIRSTLTRMWAKKGTPSMSRSNRVIKAFICTQPFPRIRERISV